VGKSLERKILNRQEVFISYRKKRMKKYPLIGVSIVAVVILIVASLTNVIGYQTVQTSQQTVIKERINQRELLFQTICDIANNKEIQRIILKSQMSRGIFPTSEIPVITKNQLKMMYFLGLILSKVISKSRIQSIVRQHQFNNQETQKEINAVIEKNTILNAEITQLQTSDCDCENEKTMNWSFPIICTLLFPLFVICFIIALFYDFIFWPAVIIDYIGLTLNCFWAI
jgi:hypothetical protein